MSASPLKFIETTPGSFDRKRKQLSRACDDCRKKKKRCLHAPEKSDSQAQCTSSCDISGWGDVLTQHSATTSMTPLGSSDVLEHQPHPHPISSTLDERGAETACHTLEPTSIIPSEGANESHRDVATTTHANSTQARGSRFIGDMNPEGIFFLAANTDKDKRRSASTRGSVGIWLAEQRGQPSRLTERCATPPRSSLFHGLKPVIQRAILPILEEECLSTVPPLAHRNALRAVYFNKIHPLLPIINKSAYDSLPDDSPSRLLLDQGICLVASADFSLRDHLFLSDDPTVLPFKDFGHRLLAAMRMTIEIGRVVDKILLTQLLALMSLSKEGPDGCENSSLMLGRAVQHLHSLGLHLRIEGEGSDWDYAETLFCCVWFLDRLSAASQGRPVLMHERDISRSMQRSFEAQDPPFRLLLHIGLLLDDVVKLYRPECTNTELMNDFVLFEDLAIECQATQIPPHLLATVEVLYHAVAILSCRPVSGGSDCQIPSSRRTRQFWSAERATALVGHEFRDQLVLLPFIPYAVSLSLSVNYRELRRSKVPTHRARARNGLEANCRILENLGEIFWSAAIMAEMGNVTLKELDRVCTNVKDDEQRKAPDYTHLEANAESVQGQDATSQQPSADMETLLTVPHDFDMYYFSGMPGLDPFEMFDPKFDLDSINSFLEGNLDPVAPLYNCTFADSLW